MCWVNRKIFWREYRALLRGHIGHFWAHIQQWKILPKAHCCIWAQKCLTWPLKRALYSLQKSSIFPPKELYIPFQKSPLYKNIGLFWVYTQLPRTTSPSGDCEKGDLKKYLDKTTETELICYPPLILRTTSPSYNGKSYQRRMAVYNHIFMPRKSSKDEWQ